jgi:hypothetical protein
MPMMKTPGITVAQTITPTLESSLSEGPAPDTTLSGSPLLIGPLGC